MDRLETLPETAGQAEWRRSWPIGPDRSMGSSEVAQQQAEDFLLALDTRSGSFSSICAALKLCQTVHSAELAGLTVGKDATAASSASSSLTSRCARKLCQSGPDCAEYAEIPEPQARRS
uniref:Uncharacterized protein n=1 Tax=Macrostomum lignano TaxID=282301 RepID=A0A1I8JRY8_9PLAT